MAPNIPDQKIQILPNAGVLNEMFTKKTSGGTRPPAPPFLKGPFADTLPALPDPRSMAIPATAAAAVHLSGDPASFDEIVVKLEVGLQPRAHGYGMILTRVMGVEQAQPSAGGPR